MTKAGGVFTDFLAVIALTSLLITTCLPTANLLLSGPLKHYESKMK